MIAGASTFNLGELQGSGLPPTAGAPLTIEESARLVAAWVWVESSLYEVVGAWVLSATGPAAKIHFDTCSQHHAWRAQLWEERLAGIPPQLVPAYPVPAYPPVPAEPAASADDTGAHEVNHHSTRGPGDRGDGAGVPILEPFCGQAVAAVEALAGLDGDVERLSAHCRVVLPRLVVGYRSWQSRCAWSSDGPVARALGFATADATADWERGTAVLLGYFGGTSGEKAVSSAVVATSELERRLLPGKGSATGG